MQNSKDKKNQTKEASLQALPQQSKKLDLTIRALQGPEGLVYRLKEQGFVVGASLRILEKLPLNGPILVELKGAIIALRVGEAMCILI